MSRNLYVTLRDLFHGYTYNNTWGRDYNSPIPSDDQSYYMEIPINGQAFEVPLFAMSSFNRILEGGVSADVITVYIKTIGNVPRYKSVDRYMRDILVNRYSSKLIVLKVAQGNETITYYGTAGAVFDEHFSPIMLCTWKIEKIFHDGLGYRFKFIRPILYIEPSIFLTKKDPMEKYIVNKIFPECLKLELSDYRTFNCINFPEESNGLTVKVEVDKMPFNTRKVSVPSISTTNQQLLQAALDHIDELIQ